MIVSFKGEAINCKHLELNSGSIRVGDIVNGMQVVTVQRDCIGWSNEVFTQFTFRDEQDNVRWTRTLFGKVDVYRASGV